MQIQLRSFQEIVSMLVISKHLVKMKLCEVAHPFVNKELSKTVITRTKSRNQFKKINRKIEDFTCNSEVDF